MKKFLFLVYGVVSSSNITVWSTSWGCLEQSTRVEKERLPKLRVATTC